MERPKNNGEQIETERTAHEWSAIFTDIMNTAIEAKSAGLLNGAGGGETFIGVAGCDRGDHGSQVMLRFEECNSDHEPAVAKYFWIKHRADETVEVVYARESVTGTEDCIGFAVSINSQNNTVRGRIVYGQNGNRAEDLTQDQVYAALKDSKLIFDNVLTKISSRY